MKFVKIVAHTINILINFKKIVYFLDSLCYNIFRKFKENFEENYMYNIEELFDEALEIVKTTIGEDKITNRIFRPIKINTRAKSRWGQCKATTEGCLFGYEIEISDRILHNSIPKDKVMNVVIHEILHACKNGMSHTGAWKMYANEINRKYPQYNITRCTSSADFGLKEEQVMIKRKYAIECNNADCDVIHYSSKMSNTIKYPERYRCRKCGGTFIRKF